MRRNWRASTPCTLRIPAGQLMPVLRSRMPPLPMHTSTPPIASVMLMTLPKLDLRRHRDALTAEGRDGLRDTRQAAVRPRRVDLLLAHGGRGRAVLTRARGDRHHEVARERDDRHPTRVVGDVHEHVDVVELSGRVGSRAASAEDVGELRLALVGADDQQVDAGLDRADVRRNGVLALELDSLVGEARRHVGERIGADAESRDESHCRDDPDHLEQEDEGMRRPAARRAARAVDDRAVRAWSSGSLGPLGGGASTCTRPSSAEGVGFEPTGHCCPLVFKTRSIGRSDNPPDREPEHAVEQSSSLADRPVEPLFQARLKKL